MPLHVREQILAVVATAITGLTTTGSNVHRARTYDQHRAALPSLNLAQGDDGPLSEATGGQSALGFVDAACDISIEARAAAASNLDTTLNLIEKEVRVALAAADFSSIGGFRALLWTGSGEPQLSDEGEQRLAMMPITFRFEYRVTSSDPSSSTL